VTRPGPIVRALHATSIGLLALLGACASSRGTADPTDATSSSDTGGSEAPPSDESSSSEGKGASDTGDSTQGEPIDDVPPAIAFASPAPGIVGGNVDIALEVDDEVGVTKVELFLDDVQLATLTAPPWELAWDARASDVGDVQIGAFAYDAAGNQGSATVLVSNLSSGGQGGAYPGDVDRSTEIDTVARSWFLYVPTSYDPAVPMPLLTVQHGAGGPAYKGAYYRDYWRQTAESHGFIVLAQDSLDDEAGGWLTADADFWTDEVTTTLESYNIDRSRIYVWGFSAGGHFAHYLGMRYSKFITAYAVHSGTLGPFGQLSMPAQLDRKIPVAIWVGTSDPNYASCSNTRDVFEAAGWVLGEDLLFTEFPGGHEAPQSQLPDVWTFLDQWSFPD
jgi:poly(3-hydroxybutyrate) depolymerase